MGSGSAESASGRRVKTPVNAKNSLSTNTKNVLPSIFFSNAEKTNVFNSAGRMRYTKILSTIVISTAKTTCKWKTRISTKMRISDHKWPISLPKSFSLFSLFGVSTAVGTFLK